MLGKVHLYVVLGAHTLQPNDSEFQLSFRGESLGRISCQLTGWRKQDGPQGSIR